MSARALLVVLVLLIAGIPARADYSTVMFTYAFQDGGVAVNVGLIDTRPVPRGFVVCPASPKRQKTFKISRQQFDQIWRTWQSSGASRFAYSENRMFDIVNNYVFYVVDMRKDVQMNFAVPKAHASGALKALARQFEAYSR